MNRNTNSTSFLQYAFAMLLLWTIGCVPPPPPPPPDKTDVSYFDHAQAAGNAPIDITKTQGNIIVIPSDSGANAQAGTILPDPNQSGNYKLVIYTTRFDDGSMGAITRDVGLLSTVANANIQLHKQVNLTHAGSPNAKSSRAAKIISIFDAQYDDQVELLDISGTPIYADPEGMLTFEIKEGYLHFTPDLEVGLQIDSPGQDILDSIQGILGDIRNAAAGIADLLRQRGDVDGAADTFDELVTLSKAMDGAAELSRPLAALQDALADPRRVQAKARIAGRLDGKFVLRALATSAWSKQFPIDLSNIGTGIPPIHILPIRVPVSGPLPIFLTFNVLFDLNLDFKGKVEVSSGFDFSTSIDTTFTLENSNLTQTNHVDPPRLTYLTPEINAEAHFLTHAGITPQIGISMAEILKATIDPEFYLEFDADAAAGGTLDNTCLTLDWGLYSGLNVRAVGRADLLGVEIPWDLFAGDRTKLTGDEWHSAACTNKENPPPASQNQSVTINFNTPKNITLKATDVNSDPLTYSIFTHPAHGALTGNPPNVTYTPNTGYSGTDSFQFKANDGTWDSNVAVVSLVVGPSLIPQNPSPADGATDVIRGSGGDITLNWEPTGGQSCDVYFGSTNLPPKVAQSLNNHSYTASNLIAGQTYYWKIIVFDSGQTYEGAVWHFTTATGSPQPGTLTLTYPNGGQTLCRGICYDITWTSQGIGPTVKIDLYKGGVLVATITTTGNTGSYHWCIGNPDSGGDYRIQISDASNSSIVDQSDSNFTINNSCTVVNVTSPSGGQIVNKGGLTTIHWTMNPPGGAWDWKFFLNKGGSVDRELSLAPSTNSPGIWSADWSVQSDLAAGNDYSLTVKDDLTQVSGDSATFTIQSGGPQSTIIQPVESSSKDTKVRSTTPTTNFDGQDLQVGSTVQTGTPITRSYVQFNLSSIPSGNTITSAKLSLYCGSYGGNDPENSNTLEVYRVTSSWNETSLTWNLQPSFNGSLLDSDSMPLLSHWHEFDVTSTVQSWFSGSTTNYGFMLKAQTEGSGKDAISNLYSSNDAFSSQPDATKRPKLTVVFNPP